MQPEINLPQVRNILSEKHCVKNHEVIDITIQLSLCFQVSSLPWYLGINWHLAIPKVMVYAEIPKLQNKICQCSSQNRFSTTPASLVRTRQPCCVPFLMSLTSSFRKYTQKQSLVFSSTHTVMPSSFRNWFLWEEYGSVLLNFVVWCTISLL